MAPWFAVALLACLVCLFRDFEPRLKFTVLAALACYAISQGLDFVEGWEFLSRQPDAPPPASLPMVVEECLEMIGTTLFCLAFLRFLAAEIVGPSYSVGLSTREHSSAVDTPLSHR